MKARYSVVIKYDVFQDVENVENLMDMHEIAHQAAQSFADVLTDSGAVVVYDVVENKMEAVQ